MQTDVKNSQKQGAPWAVLLVCALSMVGLTAAAIRDRENKRSRPPERTPPEQLARRGIPADFASAIGAVERDDLLVLKLLAASGVPLDTTDGEGMSLLATAIRSGSMSTTGWLLSRTALGKPSPLDHAVAASRPEMVHRLLGSSDRKQIGRALASATQNGDHYIVKLLLENGGDSNQAGADGAPLLHGIVRAGDLRMLGIFLAHAADVHSPAASGSSVLGVAISTGDRDATALLIGADADLDRPAIGTSTPLELALASGDGAMAAALLAAGASPHPALLHAAAADRDFDTLRLLATAAHPPSPDLADRDGELPLTRAVRRDDLELARCLLEIGADPQRRGRDGQAALPLAVAMRSPHMVRLLLDAGADANARLASPASKSFRELVDNKTMNFYLTRDSRFTPLMIAAASGEPDCIRALLEHGARRGAHTKKWERYPISIASQAENIIAQQLLSGFDPAREPLRYKIIISLSKQTATLFKNDVVINSSRVSTGRRSHITPTGNYVVTHKHRHHRSSIYNSASMPYFMRLSCSAFGTHTGHCPGYPASHGCIRMPASKARVFFTTCPTGTLVDIVK